MTDKSFAHLLVQDLLRVRQELGRFPSRDQYLLAGKYPKSVIVETFGNWTAFLHAAGGQTKQKISHDERLFDKEKAKFGAKLDAFAKFEREIKPYHGKFDRLKKDVFSVLSISDSHSQFWDEFTWRVALDYAAAAQPDLIVLGGDNLEFYKISSHNQNPQRSMSLQSEIDFVVENKLKAFRAACPKAQIDYHLGNHEARLFAYLCNNAPALSSLRALQFDKLLELNELEINLIGRESFIFRTKMDDNFKVYRGLWAWTHGVDCSQFPAARELAKHGVSGASGHVHRHTAVAKRDVFGFKSWMSVGASCTLKTGHEYIPGLINWETGFLLTFVHPKGVTQQHISTENGFACIGGTFYKAK